MLLVRYKSKKEPEIGFDGTKEELNAKVVELKLRQHLEYYYYPTGMKKNLGTDKDSNKYDYYFVYESIEEFKHYNS